MKRVVNVVLAALAAASIGPAAAQSWPSQPIRFLQGFNPGGNPDVVARLLAGPMSEMLGQPVVVEGRVGGGGVVAATATANAKPDGYTIMLVAAGFAAGVGLHKSLPYDPAGDLRRDRRLAHRLDDAVGGVDLVDVAELDRRGRGLREGCGERRRGEGEK